MLLESGMHFRYNLRIMALELVAANSKSFMVRLTHLNSTGEAHMVDVGSKPQTKRVAVASGKISMQAHTLELIVEGNHKKGDVLATAKFFARPSPPSCCRSPPNSPLRAPCVHEDWRRI